MTSWMLAALFSLILQYLNHWDNYQFMSIACLFAIFLNTCR